MKIKELPPVLCLNFKRFKYLEDLQRRVEGLWALLS